MYKSVEIHWISRAKIHIFNVNLAFTNILLTHTVDFSSKTWTHNMRPWHN